MGLDNRSYTPKATNKSMTLMGPKSVPAFTAAPASVGGITSIAPTPAAAPQNVAGGGGSSGGMAAAAAPAAAPAAPSLADFINSNFLYQQQQGMGNDALSNFDAQTMAGEQNTQADQGLRRHQLQQSQDQAGNQNAGELAAHGLLRSGVNFQNQDKIDAQGVNQNNIIDSLLSQFTGQRQTGRLNQEQANRQALNGVIQNLTTQFNGQNAATV